MLSVVYAVVVGLSVCVCHTREDVRWGCARLHVYVYCA